MSRIFLLLCVVAIALTGCNEQKKIDALTQENARLVAKLTGYKIEIKKYEPEIQKEFSSQEESELIQNNKESV